MNWRPAEGLEAKWTLNPGWSRTSSFHICPNLTSSHRTVPTVSVPSSPPLSDDNFPPFEKKPQCSWLIYLDLKKTKQIPLPPPPPFCFISLLLSMVNEVHRVVSVVFGEGLARSWDDKISEVYVLLWTSWESHRPFSYPREGPRIFYSCDFAFFTRPQETLIPL